MGALLDPLVDRLTILSGARRLLGFDLLPRSGSPCSALRGLAILASPSTASRHRVDIEVDSPGRISVFPIMGGIWLAIVFAGWAPAALLSSATAWRPSPP